MKVALINGQNHKGSTYHIGRLLAEKLTNSENIREVFLPKDMPNFCVGCFGCITDSESSCPHWQSMKPITELIDSSDVLIFTSPVYAFHASGSMKALLDHYSYRWMSHRPDVRMFHKQGVCVATAAGAGMKSTIKDMRDSLFWWGVGRVYSCGVGVQAMSWSDITKTKMAKIERKTDGLAAIMHRREGRIYPSLKTKIAFGIMRMMQKNPWNPADGDYWKDKGWMDKKRPWKP